MEQHNGDVGTKKDLMIYRLENAKSDFIQLIEEYCMMQVEKEGTS